MRIRSITSFYDPRSPRAEHDLLQLAETSEKIKSVIAREIMPVQSTRLATTPFPLFLGGLSLEDTLERVTRLEKDSNKLGWQYLALGPALPVEPWAYTIIPTLISATQNVFFSAVIADGTSLYPAAARASAQIIHQAAAILPDGFANLRFAALANVGPFTPFLPAAYHQPGSGPAISIALECADTVLEAFTPQLSLEESRRNLLSLLEDTAEKLEGFIQLQLAGSRITFKGFDFSPAPFPEDWCSLGGAAEKLGLEHIGGTGSLGTIAIIADTLDRGKWRKAGFNGMMLPLLEDSILAKRAEEGLLSVKDLMLYAAMCGTGLDTIPLAGDVTVEQLSCVLMDIGAMSARLSKPLTARLMPIPGKAAGDITGFDFAFFANSRILRLEGQPLSRIFASDNPISIFPRQKRL